MIESDLKKWWNCILLGGIGRVYLVGGYIRFLWCISGRSPCDEGGRSGFPMALICRNLQIFPGSMIIDRVWGLAYANEVKSLFCRKYLMEINKNERECGRIC